MSYQIYNHPKTLAASTSLLALPGAKLYFYLTTTTTPTDTYTTSALSVAHTNPVVADAAGVFPTIYLNPTIVYKVTYTTAADVLVYTQDPVNDQAFDASSIGLLLYPQTAAELAAGVTPTSYFVAPGYRARYSTLADLIAVSASHPAFIIDDETITTSITVPTNAQIYGIGRPQITNSSAGIRIFEGASLANVIIDGIRFKGANSSTSPSGTVGGFAATSTGIITIANSTDIRITNCEADTFYNGFSTLNCQRVWINYNRVTHWSVYGILGSLSSEASFDFNDVKGCDTSTGTSCYGIMVTGDENGGTISKGVSISFNKIQDVASWDGIMTHDVSGLQCIGNDIRNVRNGIDATYTAANLHIRNAIIANNVIEATTTNNWAAVGAASVGIYLTGFDASNLIDLATVTGNIVRGFGNITGTTISGSPGNIVAQYINDGCITGNLIAGVGTVGGYAGIYTPNTVNNLAITGNVMRGSMPSAGIRLASSTVGQMSIVGNTINQTTTSDAAINISSSTVAGLALGLNPTNSTVPFTQSASTISYTGQFIGAPVYSRVVPTYSASIGIDASLGLEFDITATNGTAFTVNNPTNSQDGQRITITIRNTSGGALGVVTWGGNYKLAALTNPANGFSRSIDFRYNGSFWVQISQTGVDVPN